MRDIDHSANTALCRDCLTSFAGTAHRCPACGSPRVVAHPELHRLVIAHIDCDAFYAAIEKRDDPSLDDKPLIIGGSRRGVVSTACYIARIKGVHSAMPMFKALKLCPEAVVLPPNMEKYTAVGRQVREMMRALTPLVEPLSIDEAFLDLTGTERLHGTSPAVTLARFARDVEAEIGISVSVGLAANKFLAKIASDLDKPRGFSVIGAAEAKDFLADKPVGMIWGVGKVTQRQLQADGIRLIGDLQRMDEADLARRYGALGLKLFHLARGEDRRTVSAASKAKSISAETTFDVDIADAHELMAHLRRLSEKVSKRLKAAEKAGWTVTLKLKTKDFRIITRSHRLADPTRLADRIFRTGQDMLAREANGRMFRLIGIGVSDFADPVLADPDDLVDVAATRRARAEIAIDDLRERFGTGAVNLGLALAAKRRGRDPSPPDDDLQE
ncbi:DNA polymerase-4 [Rhodobium orientis]|uniref:DNA polymerase IV n=1 Tax=Rhodobium orientis TaxID=34017 RepID=A0A327JF72_9HYPH|nr:DNA polymerase IV [Rhodobium orientis]MBB4301511.1 DNA polymerase-4 [Rhodobium orientis]MBK5952208.1 DNA polymerase IV [Rhodobium orientis]RAI24581.1 DNA polymerase IV [Rhodobium orientis]